MKTKLPHFIFLLAIANCLMPNFLSAQKLACGTRHALLVTGANTINTWGDNSKGELGIGFLSLKNSKIQVGLTSMTGVVAVGAGNDFSTALKNDGTVWTWGSNSDGQLGIVSDSSSQSPKQVNMLSDVKAIAAGGEHCLALKNDGTVWLWGHDSRSDDLFNIYDLAKPGYTHQVNGLSGILAIAAGSNFSIALQNDGTVVAWGSNDHGQIGNESDKSNYQSFPSKLYSFGGITAISAGGSYALALKNDSTIWSWGMNSNGQLGNGANIESHVPAQVNLLTGIIAISAGHDHCLALKNDGTVWAWGNNSKGELGNGSNANSNVPVQVNGLTDIVSIAAGTEFSVAIRKDGTVWAWGNNSDGELGNGTTVDSNVAVQGYVQH